MARRIRTLAHRVGRRGSCLLFLAILDTLIGYSLYTAPPPLRVVDLLLPYSLWAALWLAAGAACLVQAFMRNDRFAFTAAVALKIGWGGALGAVWLLHPHLDPNGWENTVIFWAFAAFIGVISSWPEHRL